MHVSNHPELQLTRKTPITVDIILGFLADPEE